MTKHITIKLTETKRQYLLGLVMVDEATLEKLVEQEPTITNNHALGWTKRVKNTLLKAKTS